MNIISKYEIKGNILKVKEISEHDKKVFYWYYDIKNWKCSVKGIKDEIPTREMPQDYIDWIKKIFQIKDN